MKALVFSSSSPVCRRQECRALTPIAGDAVTITSTPNGKTGCTTNVDGMTATMELRRDGLRWRTGQTWVDGQRTARGEVQRTIAVIEARRDIEARLGAAEAATAATITSGKGTPERNCSIG